MGSIKNNKDAFFIKRISQSEYRSPDSKQKSEEKRAAQFLNLKLPPLKLTSKKQNDEIVSLILEENKRLLDLLLPEEKHESVDQDTYLSKIFSELGLTHE